MSTKELFPESELLGGGSGRGAEKPEGEPRLVMANRRQVRMQACNLDATLPADHRARGIWSFLEKLDLGALYEGIEARGSEPGRPTIDPRILLGLWVYATSEGVGSAREVARLCESHDAYRWICGGVSVNYHTLSDFRVGHEKELDDILTQVLAVLMRQGLVKLERVAQDGMRIRASAGNASFRREGSLKECLKAAREQVERVKQQAQEPDGQRSARKQAAEERAARQREERVGRALAELPKAREVKKPEDKAKARVSTTDPEARVMKMSDGGYRPAVNVQMATDTQSRVIVGVQVTNIGSDRGQSEPMLEEIERRTGKKPKDLLVDGGFAKRESIEKAAEQGVTVYAPVPKSRAEGIDNHAPKKDDSAAIAAWRQRMGTKEAKDIYKQRAATAETVNADTRTWRGLDRLMVRGLGKALSIALWTAIAYDILRWISVGSPGQA